MKLALLTILIAVAGVLTAAAQVQTPRESTKQTIIQSVGDGQITLIYSRPNVKGRKIWGELVPFDAVWRAGANEATVFESDRDITIDGKTLPAGKYSLHMIPAAAAWTVIFNKDAGQWGSFNYDAAKDALRITAAPTRASFTETLTYAFNDVTASTAKVSLRWENLAVGFTIDLGDVNGRVLERLRDDIKNRKANDVRPLDRAAGFVAANRLADAYGDALGWLETSIAAGETYSNLSNKARILFEKGERVQAVAIGEKAISVGRAATPPVNKDMVNSFEKVVAGWKARK